MQLTQKSLLVLKKKLMLVTMPLLLSDDLPDYGQDPLQLKT